MSSTRERIILMNEMSSNEDTGNDDELYKGYNEFHPVLDTRNLQDDQEFREQVNKSGYGRSLQSSSLHSKLRSSLATNSTAGLAFSRTSNHGLKSRRMGTGALQSGLTSRIGTTGVSRPATAVRGAGYTSQSSQNRIFDPLGLAGSNAGTGAASSGSSKSFHLQDETAPEWKIKQLERQIMRLLDDSVMMAVIRQDFSQALDLAKDCVAKERSLNRLKEQSGLMDQFGPNTDLTFATMFNLAERYTDAQMWTEAINTYQAIGKNRTFTNTGRLRINIGEIYFRQKQYPKAIKFFRMALDQIPNTQNELRLKLMQNIGLAFVRLTQYADAIAAFEFILAERGDWNDVETVFHLIICYYAIGDGDKQKYYFNKLLQVKIEDQFEERYGHHEVLTNGGTIFAGSSGTHATTGNSPDVLDGRISGRASSPILLIRDEQDHYNNLLIEAIRNDRLRQWEKELIRHVEWCILTAAKLISPYIEVDQPLPVMISVASDMGTRLNTDQEFSSSSGSGYEWCLDQIRRMASLTSATSSGTSFGFTSGLNFTHLADELELYKAVKHLHRREFDQAIQTLKTFERKDHSTRLLSSSRTASGSSVQHGQSQLNGPTPTPGASSSAASNRISSASARVTSTAATNLSFLYLLQQDYEAAERYADEAISIDRYCLGAILNKGNIYYHQHDYHRAIEHYQEVVANNSTIFEAYFNLALAEHKLGHYDKALDALYRLRTVIRLPNASITSTINQMNNSKLNQKLTNTIEVNLMYQIGLIYESMGNQDQAKDFFQKVLQLVPTDVSLLVKMADLALDENDRQQSLHYLLEAYRYLPSYIPTIERLAAYYIEMKMYDQTIRYLEQLAIIQPNQIKWQLMIAASYRRSGNYQQSLTTYQTIHQRFPDNLDCLKFLIRLLAELDQETPNSSNYGALMEQYSDTLRRLEKTKELREEQKLTSSRSASRVSTATGRNNSSSSSSVGKTELISGNNLVSASGHHSREGSSTSSNGSGSSSGYMSMNINGTKSSKNNYHHSPSSRPSSNKSNAISAVVDQVVEQFDNNSMERPTTSWRHSNNNSRHHLKSSHGRSHNSNNNHSHHNQNEDFDNDDFLLDANIDEMLPD